MKRTALTPLILTLAISTAPAGIVSISTGTGAPPAVQGGVSISALTDSALSGYVPLLVPLVYPATGTLATLVTPLGPVGVIQIGGDWAYSSHGYAGKAYYAMGGTKSLEVGLSASVYAFLQYAEPHPLDLFTITVTTNDGGILIQVADGQGGAAGYGFCGTDGTMITGIGVRSDVPFAVGELYAGSKEDHRVPEPTSLLLLSLVGLTGYSRHQIGG